MRIYLETTVFNWYFDAEREGHEDVVRLFGAIKAGAHEGYTSDYVTDELKRCEEPKQSMMLDLIDSCGIKSFEVNDTAKRLAEMYIDSKVIPASKFYDSVHIAAASVFKMDAIVSYNFAHINRRKTKLLTAGINSEYGYGSIMICTAKEVLEYGKVRDV
ncbi:MAG: hypothetical protein IJS28_03465 [Synergistaceae bacterium]|nr:hypothetical protein [Synergistaceae bacterium]